MTITTLTTSRTADTNEYSNRGSVAKALFAASCFLVTALATYSQSYDQLVVNPYGLTTVSGGWSAPELIDIDGDGDMDVLSGREGGNFEYFENTGTAESPAFAASVVNPFGLANVGAANAVLGAGDLDGDGDIDLIGSSLSGNFEYFENTGTATAPSFAAAQSGAFSLSTSAITYDLSFADLDDDGDLDLIMGEFFGDFLYFENIGTATAPNFSAEQTNPFGLQNNGGSEGLTGPSFGDLDGDGDFDIITGENSGVGTIRLYENTGTASNPSFAAPVNNPFDLPDLGDNVLEACIADMDGDGDQDIMFGGYSGDFYYFEDTTMVIDTSGPDTTVNVPTVSSTRIKVWPNPTTDRVFVDITDDSPYSFVIQSLEGKAIRSSNDVVYEQTIDMTGLASGIYLLMIETGEQKSVHRVVKR